jgi:hypothetical protein
VLKVVIAEKPGGRFMIRSRTRIVMRHPEGDPVLAKPDVCCLMLSVPPGEPA